MAKQQQFTDVYGKISFTRDLAKGVKMVMTEMSARAVLVTQSVANKFLSIAAKSRSIKHDNGDLAFPAEKMSIPLFELNQKNYIDMYHSQVKEHWNTLVHFLPDYLRDRGILNAKPLPTMAEKMEDEFEAYYSELKSMTKDDIFLHSEEISAMKLIITYYMKHDLPLTNQGLLLSVPKLAEKTYDILSENDKEINNENLDQLMHDFQERFDEFFNTEDYVDDVKKKIAPIQREMLRLQPAYVQTVLLTYHTDEIDKVITLSLDDFHSFLITDDIKRSFAEKNMLDFPSADFYGKNNSQLFNDLFEKRFNENLVENWNEYAKQSDVSRMEITGLSTEIVSTTAYDELIARYSIKEYLATNHTNAQAQINELLEYASKHREVVKSVENLLAQYEMTPTQSAEAETPQADTVAIAPTLSKDMSTEHVQSEGGSESEKIHADPKEMSEEAKRIVEELDEIKMYREMKIRFDDKAGIRKIDKKIADLEARLDELQNATISDIKSEIKECSTETQQIPSTEMQIEEISIEMLEEDIVPTA